MLQLKKFKCCLIVVLFGALLLQGCAPAPREFNPELDTGYKMQGEEKEVGVSPADVFGTSVLLGNLSMYPVIAAFVPVMATDSYAVALGGAVVGGLVAGYVGSRVSARFFLRDCADEHCFGHYPYGEILVSGNVMRGEVGLDYIKDWELTPKFSRDLNLVTIDDNPRYNESYQYLMKAVYPHRVFKDPKGLANVEFHESWGAGALYDNQALDLYPGDIVDVYFPHMPEVERRAIIEGKIYDGLVVHVVCTRDDDDCIDKYERDEENFLLGRWKTLDEYLAAYAANDGFPNPDY